MGETRATQAGDPSATRAGSLRRVFLLVGTAYAAFKLTLIALYAWQVRFVMDEMGLASFFTVYRLRDLYHAVDPIKTVLHVVFYKPAALLGGDAVGVLRLARLETVALALAIVVVVYLIVRNLGGGAAEALFSVGVLLSFSTFMERVFRIRSETLAVLFALLALWAATRHLDRVWREHLAAGVLAGCAFLTTQKAVYYFVAFGVAYLARWLAAARRQRSLRAEIGPGLGFGAGFVGSLVVYAVAFGGLGFPRILRMVFTSPVAVALHAGDYYSHLGGYFVQTLSRNEFAYALCFIGLGLGLAFLRSLDRRQLFALLVTLTVGVFIFRHNQPWPYVFVMALPLFAPWSGYGVRLLAESERKRSVVYLVLLGLLALSLSRNMVYLLHDNAAQRQVVAQAESLLGRDDRYSDGTGMVPTRRWAGVRWVWEAVTTAQITAELERGDTTALDEIFADEPKVWIHNYRVNNLGPYLAPFLRESYVRVYPNVLVAGAVPRPVGETRFLAPWSGRYRLYDADGRPSAGSFLLDGELRRGEVEIVRGEHRLALVGGGSRVLLLPAGLSLPDTLPAADSPARLFERVYEY